MDSLSLQVMKRLGTFILVLLVSFIFWSLGFEAGILITTLAICLAFAGSGNRLLWLFAFAIFVSLAVVAFSLRTSLLALAESIIAGIPPSVRDATIFWSILGFGLLPLLPAVLVWSAHILRLRRKLKPRDG